MKTEDFEAKSRSMRATLKLSQDQAAQVTTAFTVLGGAFTQTGTQAGTSAAGIDRAATSLKNVKKASDDVAGGLGGVSSGIKSLSTSLGGLAIAAVSFQAIKSGVEGLLDSATKSQSLTAAFTAIAGSAQEGQKQLDFVRVTADKLGFSFTTLAGSYKGLSAASRGTILEGQATRDIFTAVTTASRVLQLSTQDTGGVLLALQQIISKGTVQSEELRGQIGERLPGAFGIAARAMGVTEKELSKLLETGAVASNVFIPKFAAQLQREFAGGAEAASKTFAAASERLGNAFARIGEAVAQSGMLDVLAKIVDRLAKIIETGPKAADALKKVATAQTERDLAPIRASGLPVEDTQRLGLDALNVQLTAQRKVLDVLQDSQRIAFDPAGVLAADVKAQQALIAGLEKAYKDLLGTVQTLGIAQASDEFATGSKKADLARVAELNAGFTSQIDAVTKALADLDARLALAPGSVADIMEERAKVLETARKAFIDTLVRNRDLAPFFQGAAGTLQPSNSVFRNANPAGLAAGLKIIQSQAPAYGLDPALVAALVYQESRFNPDAVGPRTRFGTAKGAGQLLDSTAAGLGVQDPFNLQQNLTGTMQYFSQLLKQFKGDTALALAAYNAGPGNVTKYGGIPPFAETQKYVPEVLARQQALLGTGGLSPVAQLNDLLQLEAGTKAYQDALKAVKKATEDEADAAKTASERIVQARLNVTAKALESVESLSKLNEKYAFTPEESDRAKAARLVSLAQSEPVIHALALEQQANIEVGIALKEKADALQKVADASFVEFQGIEKSTMALRAYQEQLELSGGALDAFGRATKVTAEARAVTQAEGRLRNLPPELQVEGAQVIDRLRRAAQEATPLFQGLRRVSDEFASSFLSAIESASQGGIKSFKSFADSVIRDLLRIATQQYLQPALSSLVNTGLQAAAGLFSAYGGSFTTTGTTAVAGNIGTSETIIAGAGLAEGGPVMPGGFYRVGERGPETLLAMGRGYVLPNDTKRASGSDRPIIININGVSDFPSFQRSSGQVRRAIRQGVDDATREL